MIIYATRFRSRMSLFWALLAQALILSLAVSCAGSPGSASSTEVALSTPLSATPLRATAVPSSTPEPDPSPSPTSVEGTEIDTAGAQAAEADANEDAPKTGSAAAATSHAVQPGDTLLGLAREYDVPMAAIQLENQMGESTVILAGQTLSIPPAEEWEGSSSFWVVHEVTAGETLTAIARSYDVEPEELRAVNSLADADRIAAGQNLVLPVTGPTVARAPAASGPPSPTSAPPAPAATEAPQLVLPSSGPPADLADWPREIAQLINEVRAEHGLEPYTYHPILEQAAQAHADDCAQRGWCSHVGSDGATIKTRVLRAGYDGTGWAECWAQTQSPRRAVEVWMNETPPNDPHRRTLLHDWFTEIGIGVSRADWGNYIIADFGRP